MVTLIFSVEGPAFAASEIPDDVMKDSDRVILMKIRL